MKLNEKNNAGLCTGMLARMKKLTNLLESVEEGQVPSDFDGLLASRDVETAARLLAKQIQKNIIVQRGASK